MEELDYWRLCEELNIVQAALLVVGEAPKFAKEVEQWEFDNRPDGYEAAKTAITHALRNFTQYEKAVTSISDFETEPFNLDDHEDLRNLYSRSIEGILIPRFEIFFDADPLPIDGSLDLYESKVRVNSLKTWLSLKGIKSGFFFPEPIETMDFLDPMHPRYTPKLAAAYRAWQAVTDAGKRSPKQALDKWLREHASEYGLTNDEGKPIEQAIQECSKVANWNTRGGATKTPS